MKEVKISDITMKQAGKSGEFSLSFKEKIELAKLLDRLGVAVIEISPIVNPKIDSLLIKSIAAAVKDSIIAVPVNLHEDNTSVVWSALKEAKYPRLQVCAPVSAVQMEYISNMKTDAMLEAIQKSVAACCQVCRDVEFVADDATRSEASFLYEAINVAIAAGVKTVTVCDTAGVMLPDEFSKFIRDLYQNVPELEHVTLGVSCANELSMADSCAIAAVRDGAGEVKALSYGTNSISVEDVAKILSARGDVCGARCSIRTTEMKRILRQISWMCQTNRSKNSPFDNGVQNEEGVALTSHDDMGAVIKAVEKLGYDLSEEDAAKVYEAFMLIASRKERVESKELDAIVAAAALQVPPAYRLESYVINTGNILTASAHVKMQKNEQEFLEGISLGDGPIDAAFLAIEQIVGHHYELDDFQIQAVTEGREAMGETVVRLRSGGKLYSGRGISTDIIGASILAYINALNKIVYEEETI